MDVSEALAIADSGDRSIEDPLATLAYEVLRLRHEIDCACNALTDSILCSGNDASTNLHFVRKLRKTVESYSHP